jgi:glucokinase
MPKRGENAPGTLKFDKKYLNEEFPDFVTIMRKFIEESNGSPKAACLACAGPIIDNTGACQSCHRVLEISPRLIPNSNFLAPPRSELHQHCVGLVH